MSNFILRRSGYSLLAASTFIQKVLAKDEEPKLVKPKDLPIYTEKPTEENKKQEDNWEPTFAHNSIKKLCEEVITVNNQLSIVKDRVNTFFQTGYAHTGAFVDNLHQEKNSALRVGFVISGGIAGFLLAFNKGKFKKILFTASGTSAFFYIGYPKEAEKTTKIIKRYSAVSYHFINNVTKDLSGFELPSLPSPKEESENSNEEKPELKELYNSLLEFISSNLNSAKKLIFNDKNGSDDQKNI
ncbi:MICOS complex subunit Mic27-like [Daktulosphaira vitifoliae]|uniref:MICOS complex subunit Mic27-like n=1 Tax=Daktulosphaira vitifoliae TaxID=58002 RepID=UPI0021AAFF50|nr:MICOS complex subunit Mic27-like [Daktulosphaira vitifoliae]